MLTERNLASPWRSFRRRQSICEHLSFEKPPPQRDRQ
jgi:hypothetical protein